MDLYDLSPEELMDYARKRKRFWETVESYCMNLITVEKFECEKAYKSIKALLSETVKANSKMTVEERQSLASEIREDFLWKCNKRNQKRGKK